MYRNGEGVPKDQAEAVRWYRKAVEQGDAVAQLNLAIMHASGEGGLPKSGAAAADLFYKAGLAFLKDGDKERALLCVKQIQGLRDLLGLDVPNIFLADKLMDAIRSKG